MELVPIIYNVLLFVSLLLFLAISISFIVSRFKKSTLPVPKFDNTRIINEIRKSQADYTRAKPIIHRLSSHPSFQRNQSTTLRNERKKNPNIKVIRRSNISKSDISDINKKTRLTYYPNADRGRTTNGLKSRYTILNENAAENIIVELTSTIEQQTKKEERYANFR